MSRVDTIELGEVTVTRVVEWAGEVATVGVIVPDAPREQWERLDEDFWDPATGAYRCAVQSWIVRSEGCTIVVDTGVGNDRERVGVPAFDHLSTPYLDRLAVAGVHPQDVDVVVNTHVHSDHVGWNTRREGDAWVPTFRDATYLVPRADREYFDPANEVGRPPARGEGDRLRRRDNDALFADSIAPVLDAGQIVTWEDGHRIDDHLALEPAPGHTPGSAVLRVDSGGERALFVGDILHSPTQIAAPDANSCFCEDPVAARATRRRVLERAADTGALVFPAHLPGHGAAEVAREGSAFTVRRWAAFDPLPPADVR